jgi:hypothetical protein
MLVINELENEINSSLFASIKILPSGFNLRTNDVVAQAYFYEMVILVM